MQLGGATFALPSPQSQPQGRAHPAPHRGHPPWPPCSHRPRGPCRHRPAEGLGSLFRSWQQLLPRPHWRFLTKSAHFADTPVVHTCSENDRRLQAAGAERLGHTRNFSQLGERVACMSEIRRCSSGQSDWAASVPAAFVGLAACRMLAAPPETSWLPRGRPAAGFEQQGKQNWQHSMSKTPPLTTPPATVLADGTCTRSTPASIDQMFWKQL